MDNPALENAAFTIGTDKLASFRRMGQDMQTEMVKHGALDLNSTVSDIMLEFIERHYPETIRQGFISDNGDVDTQRMATEDPALFQSLMTLNIFNINPEFVPKKFEEALDSIEEKFEQYEDDLVNTESGFVFRTTDRQITFGAQQALSDDAAIGVYINPDGHHIIGFQDILFNKELPNNFSFQTFSSGEYDLRDEEAYLGLNAGFYHNNPDTEKGEWSYSSSNFKLGAGYLNDAFTKGVSGEVEFSNHKNTDVIATTGYSEVNQESSFETSILIGRDLVSLHQIFSAVGLPAIPLGAIQAQVSYDCDGQTADDLECDVNKGLEWVLNFR